MCILHSPLQRSYLIAYNTLEAQVDKSIRHLKCVLGTVRAVYLKGLVK